MTQSLQLTSHIVIFFYIEKFLKLESARNLVPLIFYKYYACSVVTLDTVVPGLLSSLHLQAVCQLPNDAGFTKTDFCRRSANYPVVQGLPGICVFADGCQLPVDAGRPVTSIFAGGLPPTSSGAGAP